VRNSNRRVTISPMTALSIRAARWLLGLVMHLVFVVLGAGFALEVSLLGGGWFALVVGAVGGVIAWRTAMYGPADWASGQK
jgi:hypothetical protein